MFSRTLSRTLGLGISTGADLLAEYAKRSYIHCNISGTYRVWIGTAYSDRIMGATQTYAFQSTKITTISNTAVADGSVEALG